MIADFVPVLSTVSGTCLKTRRLDKGRSVSVRAGDKILQISIESPNEAVVDVYAGCTGNLKSYEVSEGDVVLPGAVLAFIEPCRHPALLNSMCVCCGDRVEPTIQQPISSDTSQPFAPFAGFGGPPTGASSSAGNTNFAPPSSGTGAAAFTLSSSISSAVITLSPVDNSGGTPTVIDSQNVTISTSGSTSVADSATETHTHSASLTFAGGQRLLLSKEEALRVQKLKTTALRSTNKLALVLDLDHTLVHATSAWTGYRDVPSGGLRSISIEESPGNPPKIYVVKLRPNVESFLRSASEICQMSIYTAGTRKYAEAVAKLLDPTGVYFKDRIVSRSDTPGDKDGLEKSLRRLFLDDASMAVIMDDREDVWKGDQAKQLLLVRPFHHFTSGEEVNNASGPMSATGNSNAGSSSSPPSSPPPGGSTTSALSSSSSGAVSVAGSGSSGAATAGDAGTGSSPSSPSSTPSAVSEKTQPPSPLELAVASVTTSSTVAEKAAVATVAAGIATAAASLPVETVREAASTNIVSVHKADDGSSSVSVTSASAMIVDVTDMETTVGAPAQPTAPRSALNLPSNSERSDLPLGEPTPLKESEVEIELTSPMEVEVDDAEVSVATDVASAGGALLAEALPSTESSIASTSTVASHGLGGEQLNNSNSSSSGNDGSDVGLETNQETFEAEKSAPSPVEAALLATPTSSVSGPSNLSSSPVQFRQQQQQLQQQPAMSVQPQGPIVLLSGDRPGTLLSLPSALLRQAAVKAAADRATLASSRLVDASGKSTDSSKNITNAANSKAVPQSTPVPSLGRPNDILELLKIAYLTPAGPNGNANFLSAFDDQLPRCLVILQEIHRRFFSAIKNQQVQERSVSLSAAGANAASLLSFKEQIAMSASSASSSSSGGGPPKASKIKPKHGSKNDSITVHQYQSHAHVTVATILSDMKKYILRGCVITFSGVIPINDPSPHNNHFWKLAVSMGAQVSQELTARTTHLLSIHAHTSKVQECISRRARDVWVLHLDWLFYCRWSLSRAVESTFMLVAPPPGAPLPNPKLDTTPLPVSFTSATVGTDTFPVVGIRLPRVPSNSTLSSAGSTSRSETGSRKSTTTSSTVEVSSQASTTACAGGGGVHGASISALGNGRSDSLAGAVHRYRPGETITGRIPKRKRSESFDEEEENENEVKIASIDISATTSGKGTEDTSSITGTETGRERGRPKSVLTTITTSTNEGTTSTGGGSEFGDVTVSRRVRFAKEVVHKPGTMIDLSTGDDDEDDEGKKSKPVRLYDDVSESDGDVEVFWSKDSEQEQEQEQEGEDEEYDEEEGYQSGGLMSLAATEEGEESGSDSDSDDDDDDFTAAILQRS